MDKAALVSSDLSLGEKILTILDGSRLAIKVSLWLLTPEYGDWRLVLSSRVLDQAKPADAYGLIHDALDEANFSLDQTPPLMIMRMDDPFIRTLRRSFNKAKSVEGMRLGGQLIGDRFVEDALVYRIQ